MKLAVISSCYGDFDRLVEPPEQSVDVAEWVMVTDNASRVPAGWRVVEQRRDWCHPRFAAKHAKALPFDYTDADVAIWIDAGARILSPRFAEVMVDALGDWGEVACWVHPERDTAIDEAELCLGIGKYHGMDMVGQVNRYHREDFYDDTALYATGCIVWRRECSHAAGEMWLAEQLRWGVQDQISFPYVLRCYGVQVRPLPQSLWRNEWVSWTGH